MKKTFVFVVALTFGLIFSLNETVQAKASDGETPADETVCDDLSGAAKGLCNAYIVRPWTATGMILRRQTRPVSKYLTIL